MRIAGSFGTLLHCTSALNVSGGVLDGVPEIRGRVMAPLAGASRWDAEGNR
jgi:hypothetical protein